MSILEILKLLLKLATEVSWFVWGWLRDQFLAQVQNPSWRTAVFGLGILLAIYLIVKFTRFVLVFGFLVVVGWGVVSLYSAGAFTAPTRSGQSSHIKPTSEPDTVIGQPPEGQTVADSVLNTSSAPEPAESEPTKVPLPPIPPGADTWQQGVVQRAGCPVVKIERVSVVLRGKGAPYYTVSVTADGKEVERFDRGFGDTTPAVVEVDSCTLEVSQDLSNKVKVFGAPEGVSYGQLISQWVR